MKLTDHCRRKIDDALIRYDSHTRACGLVKVLRDEPPDVFWPAFLRWYHMCDNTWPWRHGLAAMLRKNAQKRLWHEFADASAREQFAALPDLLTVFRGCARRRIRGLSWTLDKTVAQKFAHGFRGIPVQYPIIAEMQFPKAHIFAYIAEHEEHEIVLDPKRLCSLEAMDWERQ